MSSRLLTGPREVAVPRTLDESGYGEASWVSPNVADVVETSDGAGWNGGAPNGGGHPATSWSDRWRPELFTIVRLATGRRRGSPRQLPFEFMLQHPNRLLETSDSVGEVIRVPRITWESLDGGAPNILTSPATRTKGVALRGSPGLGRVPVRSPIRLRQGETVLTGSHRVSHEISRLFQSPIEPSTMLASNGLITPPCGSRSWWV